ncbi:hypothetical protein HN385_03635 [archaeon]|jgi:hypothetical protein|nr:hypothetical protein [archaeon]MBT3451701.1 hypothetical protein [archaeon]MBT6869789.1 hypothetical protein [archaeon]MBT7192744.1 hypothetical protein [archaeon]MBT7380769.1 hypothetical protein [archaeon]
MKRKLIKQGYDALTLTLPRKWIRDNSLKPGDEIDIENSGKKLIIKCDSSFSNKVKEIVLGKTNHYHLRSLIASTYKSGYDEIIIKFKDGRDLEKINEVVNSFTGLEVISGNKKNYVIKSFLLSEGNNIDNLIIKMFQLTKYISETAYTDGLKVDLNNLKIMLKPNTIKLRDHCLRLIHSNKFGGDKSYDYYDLVTILEKLAHAYYIYSVDFVKYNIKKSELDYLIFNNFDKSYKSFLKKDFNDSNNLWLETVDYINNSLEKDLKKNLKGEKLIMSMHYGHILRLHVHLLSRLLSCNA